MPVADVAFSIPRRSILPATASLLLASRASAAEPAAATAGRRLEQPLRKLDGIAAEALRRTGVPGMAIAVVHRDRVVYLKG
ncbi:MAG: hypothetical protein ACREFZ_12570, partial [Acetobacteraceae bacterium]